VSVERRRNRRGGRRAKGRNERLAKISLPADSENELIDERDELEVIDRLKLQFSSPCNLPPPSPLSLIGKKDPKKFTSIPHSREADLFSRILSQRRERKTKHKKRVTFLPRTSA